MGMQEVQAALTALGTPATTTQITEQINQGKTRTTSKSVVARTLWKMERRGDVICTHRGKQGATTGENASKWVVNPDALRDRPVICETVIPVNDRLEKRHRAYCTVDPMCGWVGERVRSREAALGSLKRHKNSKHKERGVVVGA